MDRIASLSEAAFALKIHESDPYYRNNEVLYRCAVFVRAGDRFFFVTRVHQQLKYHFVSDTDFELRKPTCLI